MTLGASARTHTGRVRAHNEDAAVCRPEQGLFAVIDGMGGQEAGEVAAAIAAAAIAEVPNLPKLASETVLAAAFKEARARILQQAEADAGKKDMGAVATAARFEDNGRHVALAHAGDTRAWLVNGKAVRRLTTDHVADGEPGTKRPVARDLGRRAMEGEWVETRRVAVARNDLLVLASDGLHDAVPQEQLAAELTRLWREGAEPEAVTSRLVALALARGGPDNVTVVAVRVGRFKRGAKPRRLGLPWSVVVFVAIAALAATALYNRRAVPPPAALPDRVAESAHFGVAVPVAVEAGKTTTIADGAALEVRGVELRGVDWRVEVGADASLDVAVSTIELDGALTVVLAEGARFALRDARVKAGAVRIVSTGTGAIVLERVMLDTPLPGAVHEGPVVPKERDVVRIGGSPPASPPPDGAPATPGSPAVPEAPPEAPAAPDAPEGPR